MSDLGKQLLIACGYGRYNESHELIIDEGADTDWREDRLGSSPLMVAAFQGHVDIVQLLLDNYANIHIKNNSGRTPLHHAAFNCKDGAVRLLIERGADLHSKSSKDGTTPLDEAKRQNQSSTIAIIEAKINSTKAIYTTSHDLQNDGVTFKEFNSNTIILTGNDIPDGFQFERYPIFTLQHIRQLMDQLEIDDNIPADEHENQINNLLSQSHPTILQRMQYWKVNLLHLMVYFPQNASTNSDTNYLEQVLPSVLDKYPPQAMSSVDIHGMTPLHHATIIPMNQTRSRRYCYDLLLAQSQSIVVHRAVQAGLDWNHLRPIVMAKLHALTVEDEESGLVPFMLAAGERCNCEDVDGMLGSLTMAYELLCLKPDVLKEYDVSTMVKRTNLILSPHKIFT